MTTEGEGEAPVMPYVDAATRWGITLARDANRLRLIVPPVPGVRHLHPMYLISAVVISSYVGLGTWQTIRTREFGLIPAVAIYAVIGVAVIIAAFYRLHRRFVFDVMAEELIVIRIAPLLTPTWVKWPRAEIVEIKRNASSGKLLVRSVGRDIAEFWVAPEAQTTQWVAETLMRELQSPARAPATTERQIAPVRMRHVGRRLLFAVAVTLPFIALICALCGPVGIVIAIWLLLLASIPAGLAVGTQEREYYL